MMTDEMTCRICGGDLASNRHPARKMHQSLSTCIKILRARAEAAEAEVGGDDRAVHVSFGTIVISLSMAGAYTIVATARARDQNDRALPMTARLATDARATVEFNLPLEAPAP
jgi:hypothetical protein